MNYPPESYFENDLPYRSKDLGEKCSRTNIIFMMFRVVLKADTLRLKIKETVEAQIIIRKGEKSFLMC